jgi:ABC-2 type transport system ATP-binding protein
VPSAPIEAKGLGKDYGSFTALSSLDLTISEGTCFGYLGPNGAGKSTTIKIFTNLIRPSRGQARIFGVDVQRSPTVALKRVGAVIETPEFYGYLSPLETLAYAGRLRGMTRRDIETRSDEVLKMVKLSGWADKRVEIFSKGMKQRLAIAQALLNEPDLLVLDEPTSGLDPRGMTEVRDIVKTLKTAGHTIFMSSHLLGEVQEVCDAAALLDHGKLLLQGTLDELASRAEASAFQVTFLREPSADDLAWMKTLSGVHDVAGSANAAVDLRLAGGPEIQASVLKALIGRGLEVTSFRLVGSALEQLYLENIQESER